jgi:hypothetical protein
MNPSMRTGVRAVLIASAAAVLVGCGPEVAVRSSDDSGAVVTPGVVDAFEVRVGDCYLDDGEVEDAELGEIFRVDAVPCDEPHDNEVYAIFDLPDGEFPGQDELFRLADKGCHESFADFAGVGLYQTRLDLTYLFPTEQSWARGDREVVCVVFDPAGPLEGSLAGVGDAFALPGVGDCLDTDARQVDCAGEHDSEIFLVADLEGDGYPGDEAVDDGALRLCLESFAAYVGVDYEESVLDFFYVTPVEPSWEHGDRTVLCAVFDPAGPLTGSVQGIAG